MSTYTQITYQVVFSAKDREPVFKNRDNRLRMYAYMAVVIRNKKCIVHAINWVDDHLHILFAPHPSVSLSSLIKDVKLATNDWIKKHTVFPKFSNWQRGYSAFSYSREAIPKLVQYVENQEAHHAKESSLQELKRLLGEQRVDLDDRFLA